MPDNVIKETRVLAEDEVIDISLTQVPVSSEIPHGVRYSLNYRVMTKDGWFTVIRFDNAHTIKGHSKRDHKHLFNNKAHEAEFSNLKELFDELMKLIEDNRRIIDEIKKH